MTIKKVPSRSSSPASSRTAMARTPRPNEKKIETGKTGDDEKRDSYTSEPFLAKHPAPSMLQNWGTKALKKALPGFAKVSEDKKIASSMLQDATLSLVSGNSSLACIYIDQFNSFADLKKIEKFGIYTHASADILTTAAVLGDIEVLTKILQPVTSGINLYGNERWSKALNLVKQLDDQNLNFLVLRIRHGGQFAESMHRMDLALKSGNAEEVSYLFESVFVTKKSQALLQEYVDNRRSIYTNEFYSQLTSDLSKVTKSMGSSAGHRLRNEQQSAINIFTRGLYQQEDLTLLLEVLRPNNLWDFAQSLISENKVEMAREIFSLLGQGENRETLRAAINDLPAYEP